MTTLDDFGNTTNWKVITSNLVELSTVLNKSFNIFVNGKMKIPDGGIVLRKLPLTGIPTKIIMNGIELKLPSTEEIKIFELPSTIKIFYITTIKKPVQVFHPNRLNYNNSKERNYFNNVIILFAVKAAPCAGTALIW